MLKPRTIGMLEKYDVFTSVKADAEYVNGTFGTVADGVFTAGAGGYVIMQKGKGDTLYTDFTVVADEDIRVADVAKWVGKQLEVSPLHIIGEFTKGDTLIVSATGKLAVGDAVAGNVYFEVEEVINFDGVGALLTIAEEPAV